MKQLCDKYERPLSRVKAPHLERLRRHTFPGNVRELRNLLERSLLRADPDAPELEIDLSWLKVSAQSRDREGAPNAPDPTSEQTRPELTPIEQQEYDLIAKALSEEDGAIRRAAAKLGLTHQALLRRLQKWPELRRAQQKEH
jgi:DNA-binding NtrC family response regulator